MNTDPNNCVHLTLDIVNEIHDLAIAQFGGGAGLRDMALLESAIAAPQATFGGESVFADVIEVAAAYLFYLCRNHAYVDGNKRVALGACLVFLRLNEVEPAAAHPPMRWSLRRSPARWRSHTNQGFAATATVVIGNAWAVRVPIRE